MPLNIIALSTLPRHIMTQGTAIRSLMRNLGGSIGISILEAHLGPEYPDGSLAPGRRSAAGQSAGPGALSCAAPFSLSTPGGMAALNAEVTRQAAMVAYIDDFKLIMLIVVLASPLLLLIRPRAKAAAPAAGD